MGWLGGLLYLAIFVIIFFYLVKSVNSDQGGFQPILLIALPVLSAYSCDAFFNFPLERPVMQFYFALLAALAVNLHLVKSNKSSQPKTVSKNIFIAFALILLLPAAYINYQVYRSLIAQSMVNKDIMNAVPAASTEEVMHAFPAIPNMNAYCFPVGDIKAIYLLRDKKYDEALKWLDKSKSVNPYLSLDEFLRARIYYETNKIDSAYKYISIAFAAKPRASSSYELLNTISVAKRDTALLQPAFNQYIHYRPDEPFAWNLFLVNGYNLQMNRQNLLRIADSAINKFPANADLAKTREVLLASIDTVTVTKNSGTGATIIANQNDDPEFRKEFDLAMTAFTGKDYKTAIQHFGNAGKLNPHQYLCFENIGICYYSMGDYEKAMTFFDGVLHTGKAKDGKSEFFKAACLISLNRKDEACPLLRISQSKNYSQAPQLIASYCQ
jgi:tetratricopeptide (TPR) repeat protein